MGVPYIHCKTVSFPLTHVFERSISVFLDTDRHFSSIFLRKLFLIKIKHIHLALLFKNVLLPDNLVSLCDYLTEKDQKTYAHKTNETRLSGINNF